MSIYSHLIEKTHIKRRKSSHVTSMDKNKVGRVCHNNQPFL